MLSVLSAGNYNYDGEMASSDIRLVTSFVDNCEKIPKPKKGNTYTNTRININTASTVMWRENKGKFNHLLNCV